MLAALKQLNPFSVRLITSFLANGKPMVFE
jgi:hypothetical protein